MRISHVCNDGHEGRYCICGEYGELIHVEGGSTTLNGHDAHHEVVEGHLRILRCGLGGRCKRSTTWYVFPVGVGVIS